MSLSQHFVSVGYTHNLHYVMYVMLEKDGFEFVYSIIIIIIICPLTVRVVEAPQVIWQPDSSIFLFPLGLGELQALMLSSHFFFCLPVFYPPFTVPCHVVLQDLINGRSGYTTAVCLFLRWSRRFSCGRITCWIFAGTSSLVTRCL